MANRIDQNADDSQAKRGPANGNADPGLQRSVDKAVPAQEKLPGRAAENPLSQQVKEASGRPDPEPGSSTPKGGDKVPVMTGLSVQDHAGRIVLR